MTAKEYLEQYAQAVIIAERMKIEYDKESELLDSIRSPLGSDGLPHGGGISKQVEQKAVRLAEKRNKYQEAEIEASLVKARVLKTINKVQGDPGSVLYERYVNLRTWGQIADVLGYSERQCYNLRNQGLDIVDELIK